MYVDNFLLTNLQNFKQKDLTEVKICEKVIGGGGLLFLKTPRTASVIGLCTGNFKASNTLQDKGILCDT